MHLDASCNECGNCATFCPWEGKPYRDKLTVFTTEEDYRSSTNPGFFLADGKGMLRMNGGEGVLTAAPGAAPRCVMADERTLSVVGAIVAEHAYLLGGVS